jgi:hypothetical protein
LCVLFTTSAAVLVGVASQSAGRTLIATVIAFGAWLALVGGTYAHRVHRDGQV